MAITVPFGTDQHYNYVTLTKNQSKIWYYKVYIGYDGFQIIKGANNTVAHKCYAKITIQFNYDGLKESYGPDGITFFENARTEFDDYVRGAKIQQSGVTIYECLNMKPTSSRKDIYTGIFEITYPEITTTQEPTITFISDHYNIYDVETGGDAKEIIWNVFVAIPIEYHTPKFVVTPDKIKTIASGTTSQTVTISENNNGMLINIARFKGMVNDTNAEVNSAFNRLSASQIDYGSAAAIGSLQYNYTTKDVASGDYCWHIGYKAELPEPEYSTYFDNVSYYIDEKGGYHCKRRGWTPHPDYCPIIDALDWIYVNATVEADNDALSVSNLTLTKLKANSSTATFPVFVNNNKMKMKIDFTLNFSDTSLPTDYGTTYTIQLVDKSHGGQTFIDTFESISGNQFNKTLSYTGSPIQGQAREMDLVIRVTEAAYGRTLEYSIGKEILYSYNNPEVTYLDAYRSNSNGELNLNSRSIMLMATWEWSDCGGANNITKKQLVIKNTAGSTLRTLNLTNNQGQKLYLTAYSFAPGTDYKLQFVITDTFGSTGSATISLSNENVLMDFNNSGLGVAIGKLSEQNCFEVAIPAVFYQNVEYINGSRSTADAANSLGFEDNYNTGCKTIQQVLDYIVARLK